MKFIDCQGLAGAWTLAASQTGMECVGRKSLAGGFGDQVISLNADLIGGKWEPEVGDSSTWETHDAQVVVGTPPCSGFSGLNTSGKEATGRQRGINDSINTCMRHLVEYGSRTGADIIAFESVQDAYKMGRPFMQALRDLAGREYSLTHVLMSGSSVGAAQMRHRYYAVFHKVPFGCEHPERRHVVTYRDAIGDLEGCDPFTWGWQPYPSPASASEYARGLLDYFSAGFYDHMAQDRSTIYGRAIEDLCRAGWEPGSRYNAAVHNYVAERGTDQELPSDIRLNRLGLSWQKIRRPLPDVPGHVLTGAAHTEFAHYAEPRPLTVRELSRLMGYPDAWRWNVSQKVAGASKYIGKCAPVPSCRWISWWIAESLAGAPGEGSDRIGDREYLFDCTNDYKPWLADQIKETAVV